MKHNTWQLINNAVLETLEGRQMMSATLAPAATLDGSVLSVDDSTNNDPTRVVITYGVNHNTVAVDNNGVREVFPTAQVQHININLGNGTDTVIINPALDIPADVTAGNGSDHISTGAGDDSIIVGNGNDVINGQAGNDSITTGAGNDIVLGASGNDSITTGNGNDVVLGGSGADMTHAGNGNDDFYTGSGRDTVIAGTGHDIRHGGISNLFIFGQINAGTPISGGATGSAGTTASSGAAKAGATAGSTSNTGPTVSTSAGASASGTGSQTASSGTTAAQSSSSATSGASNGQTSSSSSGTTASAGLGATSGTGSVGSVSSTDGADTGSSTDAGDTTGSDSGSASDSTDGSSSTGGTSSTSGSTTTTTTGTTTTSGTATTTGTTTTGDATGASTTSGTSSTSGTTTTTGTGTTGTTTTGTTTTGTATSGTGSTTTTTGPTTTTNNTDAPVAAINVLAGNRFTGLVVNAEGLNSTSFGSGSAITTNFAWDFGDPNGTHNTMTGFNAAHVYDQPGTYTISLTVTNNLGLSSTATQQVTIAASTRKQIFVDSVNGSDSNAGTQAAPLKSVGAAFALLTDNTEILLKAGETFSNTLSMHVNSQNVLIGRYGTGANPTIIRQHGNGISTIASYGSTNGLTIQDITFDSPFAVGADGAAPKTGVSGVYAGGSNICIRDCTFLNIDDAVNENGCPTGVLIMDNTAPLTTGVRGYFVWGEGAEQVFIGNTVANSTREHNIRMIDLTEVTIEDNSLANLTSRVSVDMYDRGKGCIEVHRGADEWIQGNTILDGEVRVGPLGLWGEDPSTVTDTAVITDNILTDAVMDVQSGSHHIMIDNNVINSSSGNAFEVFGTNPQGRTSSDIFIENNTATDSGTTGNFIHVMGVATDIQMTGNLWVAPNIKVGSNGTTPVRVDMASLSDFSLISNNVWPDPVTTGTYANGGINFVGTVWNTANFMTAAQWDAQTNVQNDLFDDASLTDSYQITVNATTVGADLAMAA